MGRIPALRHWAMASFTSGRTASQAQEGELPLQVGGRGVGRDGVPNPAGGTQHPQGPACHGFVGRQNFLAPRLGQLHPAALFFNPGAPLQHLVRRALGKLKHLGSGLVHRGHHFPAGIEGRLTHPGGLLLHTVFI